MIVVGRSIRIELKQYWPFLAFLFEFLRLSIDTPPNIPTTRTIFNDPAQQSTEFGEPLYIARLGEFIPLETRTSSLVVA